MMRTLRLYIQKIIIFIIIFSSVLSGFHIQIKKENNEIKIEPKVVNPVKATYQFTPSSGQLVTGTAQTILSATAASNEGVNTGSWKGTLGDDDYHWANASTSSGYDVQLVIGAVQLNGANTIMIQTEFDLDATAPTTVVQICDWVTSTSVDNAADARCTTGGWRTLNNTKTGITTVTPTAYHWQIYDGYWSNGSNTPISTPLTNFINGSNEVRIRYYSTTNTTSVVSIDYLRVFAVINSIYSPAAATNLGSGGITGEYPNTTVITQGASDNTRFEVAGTAGTVADMYFSFKNVKTYTGMNTIMVRAEYSCSAASGLTHRPKIYNFNSSSWEDLSTASITCSTTDATSFWAKNNVTISNYISNGEIRVGWRGLSNSTTALRFDLIYMMVGSTNSDTSACEITFGTNNSGDCSNTRTLDGNATASTWKIATEDESNTFGHDFYYSDDDADAVVEEAGAATVDMPITPASNMVITGILYSARIMSGVAGAVTVNTRSYGNLYATTIGGGFQYVAAASGTTSLVYSDNILVGGVSWGGPAGGHFSAISQVDTVNSKFQVKLGTNSGGATSNNSINEWDFVMLSIQWVEDASHPTPSWQYQPTGGQLVTGTAQNILAATVASNEGVNTGSWRGVVSNEDFHWQVASTSGGYDMQLVFGGVQLNGANTLTVVTEFDLDATAPDTVVQICDWESSTSVDNAADARCTGGGWRTLNNRKVVINTTSPTSPIWLIYDGYWSNGSNTSISTPLTNFVKSTNEVRIRLYSTTNTTSVVSIDSMIISAVVNPLYMPAGITNLGSGAITGDYTSTTTASQGFSDDVRVEVAGTAGSISDFYFSFKNVKTYTGMNTIYFRTENSCSAASGLTYRPKIYNFNSASWEDLTPNSITCATSDTTRIFVKNNVTISNYISNGEIRIGWRGLSNSTTTIRSDAIYMIVGTTNTDTNDCEITFGTNSAGDCSRTRDFDSTGSANAWQIATEDESNTFSHDYYALDNDGDAVVEEAAASHIKFAVTLPTYSHMTSVYTAVAIMSGVAGAVNISIRDYSGIIGNIGGYSQMGISAGSTGISMFDNVQSASYLGSVGTQAQDYIDNLNNKISLRLRTGTSGATSNNSVNQWDFALVAPQWVESKPVYTQSAYRLYNNANSTDVGSTLAAQDTAATLASTNAAFRLRMLLHLDNDDLRLSQNNFKLQYVGKGTGTCASPSGGTPSAYTDVSGSTLIAFNDNATPTDNTALTTNANDPTHGTHTVRQQSYEELNNFTNSQKIINSGQDGLWDFSLKDNSSPIYTTYCFRMVESDGTVLSTYSVYPEITTVAPSVTMTISDSTVGFGTLSSSASRYATDNLLGSASQPAGAHLLYVASSSTSGLTLYVKGATLTNQGYTINSIGGTGTSPSPGTEQFGLTVIVNDFDTVLPVSPYDVDGQFGYNATSSVADDVATSSSAGFGDYGIDYLANIYNTTEPGSYSTTLTYTVVGNF